MQSPSSLLVGDSRLGRVGGRLPNDGCGLARVAVRSMPPAAIRSLECRLDCDRTVVFFLASLSVLCCVEESMLLCLSKAMEECEPP